MNCPLFSSKLFFIPFLSIVILSFSARSNEISVVPKKKYLDYDDIAREIQPMAKFFIAYDNFRKGVEELQSQSLVMIGMIKELKRLSVYKWSVETDAAFYTVPNLAVLPKSLEFISGREKLISLRDENNKTLENVDIFLTQLKKHSIKDINSLGETLQPLLPNSDIDLNVAVSFLSLWKIRYLLGTSSVDIDNVKSKISQHLENVKNPEDAVLTKSSQSTNSESRSIENFNKYVGLNREYRRLITHHLSIVHDFLKKQVEHEFDDSELNEIMTRFGVKEELLLPEKKKEGLITNKKKANNNKKKNNKTKDPKTEEVASSNKITENEASAEQLPEIYDAMLEKTFVILPPFIDQDLTVHINGQINYTKSIEQWFDGPTEALKDQGYLDPNNSKKFCGTKEKEKFVTQMHTFSHEVDKYIFSHGIKKIIHSQQGNVIHLAIPVLIKTEKINRPDSGMCEYILQKQKNGSFLCFHRNLLQMDTAQFLKNYVEDNFFNNTQFYDNQFPKLQ